jgi:hypothetical protein
MAALRRDAETGKWRVEVPAHPERLKELQEQGPLQPIPVYTSTQQAQEHQTLEEIRLRQASPSSIAPESAVPVQLPPPMRGPVLEEPTLVTTGKKALSTSASPTIEPGEGVQVFQLAASLGVESSRLTDLARQEGFFGGGKGSHLRKLTPEQVSRLTEMVKTQ